MKRSSALPLLLVLLCCPVLSSCGYTWRGERGPGAPVSVMGTGTSTVKIVEVEQPTIYTNVPYIVRSLLRDEINARGLAVWQDSGVADFGIIVRVQSFRIGAYGHSGNENFMFTATLHIEFVVTDGHTDTEVWSSGPLAYSENYSEVDEETAIRETLENAVRRGVDRMQQRF